MPRRKVKTTKTRVPGIIKAGDVFLVRARWRDPKTGKAVKREGTAATFEAAVNLTKELRTGPRPETSSKIRFEDYAVQWMGDYAIDRAPSTRDRYARELARIITVLGDVYVNQLGETDIRRWRDDLVQRCVKTTVNAHLRTLRVCLEPLVRKGVLHRNPARDVPEFTTGRTRGRRGTALTADQIRRVLKATRELMGTRVSADVGRMIEVLAWTGMRKGELLALRWEDQQGDELFVRLSVCKKTRNAKTTKTDDPRLVPIPPPLAEILAEQRQWLIARQHPGLASGLVFPASPHHALIGMRRRELDAMCWHRSDSVLDRPLKAVVERANVPAISPHSFRRTYEDLLRRAGVNDFVRRTVAGWRTKEAQAIYAGVDPEERKLAGTRFAALLADEDG